MADHSNRFRTLGFVARNLAKGSSEESEKSALTEIADGYDRLAKDVEQRKRRVTLSRIRPHEMAD